MTTTGPVTTVTDELLAELDRSVRVVWRDDDAAVIAVGALTTELRSLRAENAELAKDAGRYRWIAKRSTYGIDCRQRPALTLPIYAPDHIDHLGAAIDTAMAAQ